MFLFAGIAVLAVIAATVLLVHHRTQTRLQALRAEVVSSGIEWALYFDWLDGQSAPRGSAALERAA